MVLFANVAFPDFLYAWDIVESWMVRVSIALGIITLFPGLVAILYDCILYVWRFITAPASRNDHREDLVPEKEDVDEGEVATSVISATETANTRQRTVSKSGNEILETAFLTTSEDGHIGGTKRAD